MASWTRIGNWDLYFIRPSVFFVFPSHWYRWIGWTLTMLFALTLLIHVSPPNFSHDWRWWFFIFLVKCNVVLSGKAVLGDPGVVPPCNRNEADDGSGLQKPNPICREVDPYYMEDVFSMLYCRTCKHLRKPDTSHCKICDVCVRGFDHHCIVLGCCVGERNIGSFILYLFSVSLSAAYGTYLVLWIAFNKESLSVLSVETGILLFLLLCGGFTAVLVGMFACYYLYLTISRKTSKNFLTSAGQPNTEPTRTVLQHLKLLVRPGISYIPRFMDGFDERVEIGHQN